jgi:hypothetical protein
LRLSDAQTRLPALVELAVLLKRAALTAFPRTEAAALTGPVWLAFLDRTASMQGFKSDAGALLERAAFDPVSLRDASEEQARESATLVKQWLHQHRADLPPRNPADAAGTRLREVAC